MYQLYAYARKYDSEELYLIYPKCETFASPSIAPFYYHGNGNEGGEKTVVLHVINYDLVTDFCCVCDWGAIDGFE
jgi:5-methylcytosine-specific restriction endonuclease McrBC regulatory subunit McrC